MSRRTRARSQILITKNQDFFDAWVARSKMGDQSGEALEYHDLSKIALSGLDLTNVVFRHCSFKKNVLTGGHLDNVQFEDCDLQETKFVGVHFTATAFRRCSLDQAKFTGVSTGLEIEQSSAAMANFEGLDGLSSESFVDCNVRDASLPKCLEAKDVIKELEDRSASANKAFAALLAVCGYTLLSNATLADAGLFTTSQYTAKLPILNVDIPTTSFYLFAPMVVLGAYGNFHFEATRLWETAGGLPLARFNERRLAGRVKQWVLMGVIEGGPPTTPRTNRLKHWWNLTLISWLGWGSGPITLAALLGKSVKSHEGPNIAIHALATIVASFWAMWLYWKMQSSLRWSNQVGRSWVAWSALTSVLTATFVVLCVIGAYSKESFFDIEWNKVRGIYAPFADLQDADISMHPSGWKADSPESFLAVRPARLIDRDLRYANAESAFLCRADMDRANMPYINLKRADLRRANFRGGCLDDATLVRADLREADLTGTTFLRAKLTELKATSANFRNANLSGADLDHSILGYLPKAESWMRTRKGADFTSANLTSTTFIESAAQGVNFYRANLTDARLDRGIFALANFMGANLTRTVGSGCNFMGAELDTAILDGLDLKQANLYKAGLRGSSGNSLRVCLSDLRKVDFNAANWSYADLTNTNIDGATFDGSRFSNCQFTFAQGAIARAVGARFSHCWFNGARLNRSDLRNAIFINCYFQRADLTGANVEGAHFINCSFKGIEYGDPHVNEATLVSPENNEFPKRLVAEVDSDDELMGVLYLG